VGDARADAALIAAPWALLAVGLAAVLAAPGGVLLWTPLLLGVPHLAGDLRALWVRPLWPVSRSMGPWWLALAGALIALRAAPWLGWTPPPGLEVGLGAGGLALSAAFAPSGAGRGMAIAAVGGLLAWGAAPFALLALGHLHNVVAVVVAVAWASSSGRPGGGALAAWAVCGAAAAAAGWGPWDTPEHGAFLRGLGATLAPGLEPVAAAALVRVYAWLQLVHYAVWLVVLPQGREDGGWRALGGPTLALFGAGTALLLVAVALAPAGAAGVRGAYLSLASFHGWIELAVLAHGWGRR
jgi:hypothetical protein